MLKLKKNLFNAFTLAEIIVVIVLVSGTLLTIVMYIQSSLKQVRFANHKVIALNLAKEGMESVYYARNARVLTHSGENRNKCRLALNSEKCPTNVKILDEWYYRMDISKSAEGVQKVYFSKRENPIQTENITENLEKNNGYALYLSGDIWITKWAERDNRNRYGRFFREIQWLGIYQKNEDWTDTKLECNWKYIESTCWDNSPKEFRFCSIVKYQGLWSSKMREEKLCGVMTNFFPDTDNF